MVINVAVYFRMYAFKVTFFTFIGYRVADVVCQPGFASTAALLIINYP